MRGTKDVVMLRVNRQKHHSNVANNMESSQDAAQNLEALAKSMDNVDEQALQQDPAARAHVFASARRLCQRLESPWERIARMFWGEVRLHRSVIIQYTSITVP